jgi:YHS domain-containing protein
MRNRFLAFLATGFIAAVALPGAAHAAPDAIYTGTFSNVALSGYDTVGYFTQGKPVLGSAKFKTVYKGAEFHFASAANLAKFKANPAAYAPQYGGYCAWAVSQGYTRVGRSQGVEDRRRQAVRELRQGHRREVGKEHPRLHRGGQQELAQNPRQLSQSLHNP